MRSLCSKESTMTDLLVQALAAYAITFLLTMSQAGLYLWRNPIERLAKDRLDYRPELRDGILYFIQCRMCTGFWVSLGVVICYGSFDMLLPVYGLSYFLATQERD